MANSNKGCHIIEKEESTQQIFRIVHSDCSEYCNKCSFQANNGAEMTQHKKSHAESFEKHTNVKDGHSKPISCAMCYESFENESEYQIHTKSTMHKENDMVVKRTIRDLKGVGLIPEDMPFGDVDEAMAKLETENPELHAKMLDYVDQPIAMVEQIAQYYDDA